MKAVKNGIIGSETRRGANSCFRQESNLYSPVASAA
jgi:hypothetical protein